MGLKVTWYDVEHTILVATIAKDTIWADYHDAIDQIVKHASAVGHRVDVIFLDDVGMPPGNPFPHLKQGIGKLVKQPNIHLSLIAGSRGSTGFVRAIMETIGRAFSGGKGGMPGLFARTLDEALTRIHDDRIKQPELPVSKS